MQRQNRPRLPPKIRIITAWVIWFFLTLQVGGFYFVAWVAIQSPSRGGTLPVQTLIVVAGGLGLINLMLMSYRRSRTMDLQKRFILLLIGMVAGEPIGLFAVLLRFANQVPDIALGLIIACVAIQLLNIPTDFNPPLSPRPGEPVIPQNIV
jgi:hypothetical protein